MACGAGWEGAAASGAARGFTFHQQKINRIQSDPVNEASKLRNYSRGRELISRSPLLWRELCWWGSASRRSSDNSGFLVVFGGAASAATLLAARGPQRGANREVWLLRHPGCIESLRILLYVPTNAFVSATGGFTSK